jgi:hypothetical protein
MRFLTLLALSVAAIASLPDPSRGGWGGGACALPAAVAAPMIYQSPTYHWVNKPGSDQYHLMFGDKQLGTFRVDDCLYYPFDGEKWGEAQTEFPKVAPVLVVTKDGKKVRILSLPAPKEDPPKKMAKAGCDCCKKCNCGEPCECSGSGRCSPDCDCGKTATEKVRCVDGDEYLTGVDRSRIHTRERYTINGREVAESQAKDTAGGGNGTLTDDSNKLYLAFVDPKAKDIIASAPAEIRDKYLCDDYAEGEWATCDRDGKKCLIPGITLVARDGTQLHHQASMDLVALATALRKADPNFDPNKTPDKSKPDPSPGPILPAGMSPQACCILGGVGLLLILILKKGRQPS